ncbi:hypothetical protein HSB1_46460 [Halogranum salarium B-1]|uniref:Uncharacterized protein n=1 Tax=Halogranum salarium B-1 TaxID=1210908 RepID=J2Z9F2_9EURY|nr:hypothetical protein HSB1_46460 [Halogranum salarium B-1]
MASEEPQREFGPHRSEQSVNREHHLYLNKPVGQMDTACYRSV